MDLEEKLQNLPVTDRPGIEDDIDALGVSAVAAVGRVRSVATGVAYAGRYDAGELRIKSCIPQKQPPAKTALSGLSLIQISSTWLMNAP